MLSIKSWYGYKELIRQVIFCAAPRDGVDVDALREMADELHEDGGQAVALDLPPVELSSTKIRLLFENHLSAAGMLPASVEEYIYARGLYGANHAGNGQ